MSIDVNGHELTFTTEFNGEEFIIAVDKVGGGTIGSKYDCQNWRWTAYNGDGEEVKSETFHVCGETNHFKAAKHIFELIEEGSVKLGDISERVSKGVHLLDHTIPQWRKLVDTSKLNINDATACILGQIFYDYNTGLTVMVEVDSEFDATEYGFDTKGHEADQLKDEWISRILSNI